MKHLLLLFTLIFNSLNYVYAKPSKTVLLVLTSHDKLGDTGMKTGFWLPELTHPYYELIKAGFNVDIASPKGGVAPLDKKSLEEKDPYNNLYLEDNVLRDKVLNTIALKEIDPKKYGAILFAGGSGPMWDFVNNEDISKISSAIYEAGGVVSAICHGTAALVDIKLSNGQYLITGKKFAAFTKQEERSINQYDIVPFFLEDKLTSRGGTHINGSPWQENVIVDGRLVTGQNPASALKATKEVIKILTR